jgi:hypothetical protein
MPGIEPRPVEPVAGRYNDCVLVNYIVQSLVHYSYVLVTHISRPCVSYIRSNTVILHLRVDINGVIAELMIMRGNSRTCSTSLTEISESIVNHTRFVVRLEIREVKQL